MEQKTINNVMNVYINEVTAKEKANLKTFLLQRNSYLDLCEISAALQRTEL